MYKVVSACVLGAVVLTSIAIAGTPTPSDYWLQTVLLSPPEYRQLASERFISYFDCRERGLKNLELLASVDVKAGFTCDKGE